jgi:hypothetical protein
MTSSAPAKSTSDAKGVVGAAPAVDPSTPVDLNVGGSVFSTIMGTLSGSGLTAERFKMKMNAENVLVARIDRDPTHFR